MKKETSQNLLDDSFDKSFMLLCPINLNQTQNLIIPPVPPHLVRLSKTYNQIPNSIKKIDRLSSNDDLMIESTPHNPQFERKTIAAKTTIESKIQQEAQNFFRDSKFLGPNKILNFEEKSANSNGSRRVSQLIPDNAANNKYRKSHFNKEGINVFKVSDEKKKNKKIICLEKFLESAIFQILITTLIIYALFGTDIKFLCFNKDKDLSFDILTLISLIVFTLEIIISIVVKKDYLFSFFFWLDVFSTMTLILDLSWVDEALFGGNNSQLSKANKSSKIGSRAGRIIRIVRLFRLVRIIKIWKTVKMTFSRLEKMTHLKEIVSPLKNHESPGKISKFGSFSNFPSQANIAKIMPKPLSPPKCSIYSPFTPTPTSPKSGVSNTPNSARSYFSHFSSKFQDLENKMQQEEMLVKDIRVGKKLSELTTKRVSVLAMVLIFVVPLFDSNYYYDKDKSYTIGLKFLVKESEPNITNLTEINLLYADYISTQSGIDVPLIYCYIPSLNVTWKQPPDLDYLRFEEKEELDVNSDYYDLDFISIINVKVRSQMNALLNILRTITISMILGFGAYFFTKDTNELALKPISRMIEKVNKIASNPLATKDQVLIHSTGGMETVAIENAIIKIGTLLALGFGDAGSEIIAKNVSQGGDVDPMLPGMKQYAIFGFCDIRNFTDTTEVLQEDVMVFVNRIAYIVHKTVDKYMGVANKNIGDAFLLLWKFEKEDIEELPNQEFIIKRTSHTKNLSDFALIAFLKIICSINTKEDIIKYRNIKALKARIPDYKVKMGFGLHVGWAIEGAIGSNYKIDASYLSPNVNIASRLEAATKQYGVGLLISHELYNRFSKRVQRFCRELDRVTVKGSNKPLGLFTLDIDLSVLSEKANKGYSKEDIKLKHKFKKNNILEQFFVDDKDNLKASLFFEYDENLVKITNNAFGTFRNSFKQGFENYINGKWDVSHSFLEECPNDGPTMTLLNFMKFYNYQAPPEWPGYRELIDK